MHACDLPFSLYLNDPTKEDQVDKNQISYSYSEISVLPKKKDSEATICKLISCYMVLLYRYTGNQQISSPISINNHSFETDLSFNKKEVMTLGDINSMIVNWWEQSVLTLDDNMEYHHSLGDIELVIDHKTKDKWTCSIKYKTACFFASSIQHFVNQLKFIFDHASFEEELSKIQLIDTEEQNIYLNFWNNKSQVIDPHQKSILALFYSAVKKNPNKVAVVYEEKQLTFYELLTHVEKLSYRLKISGINKGDNIGVLLERSHWSIISLLAIVHCGAVYVPLDISYPKDYIRYITDTVKLKCVISQKILKGKLSKQAPTLIIEDINESLCTTKKKDLFHFSENRDDSFERPFCILFTSGSTAKAKGVLHAQQSFIKRFYWMWSLVPIQNDDVFLQRTTVNFGPSIWEFLGGLLQGAKTVILPESAAKIPEQILLAVKEHHVTRIGLVPSLLKVLLDIVEQETCSLELKSALNKVRICSVAGEALNNDLFYRFTKQLPQVELYNDFGSTEINGIFFCNTRERPNGESLFPIGLPANHVHIYVLDDNGKAVPPGMPGTLHVAGDTLALRYIDSDAKEFPKNPFSSKSEAIFNTGDCVKFNQEGMLFLLGRNDNMVKIRGMRVNLTQVEAAIKTISSVDKSAVLVRKKKNGDNQIVAFIVQSTEKSAISIFRTHLEKKLPAYMLPASIIDMPELPLLPNGKIDKQSLLNHLSAKSLDIEINTSSDSVEASLLAILYNVIELPQTEYNVNPQCSFSELGLDSISAIGFVSQINKYYGISLQTTVMFDYPSLGDFCHFIKQKIFGNTEEMLNYTSVENTLLMADKDKCYKQISKLPTDYLPLETNTNILLTGASGYLGCFIIECLLKIPNKKIYCIVRGKDNVSARSRLIKQLKIYKIRWQHAEDRLLVLNGDLSSENMGLSNQKYELLAADTSHIFHCGAHVDHFCGYGGLRDVNTKGVMEVIRLASYKRLKNISFTSTIGVTICKKQSGEICYSAEEKSIADGGDIVSAYGKSKWLSEQLLEKFAEHSNANINIYRIGEISGHSKSGACREDDIFHNMIKSFLMSQEYPLIPNAVVDILPVDFVSTVITTLGLSNKNTGLNIYHLSHSAPILLSKFLALWSERQLSVARNKSIWLQQCRDLVKIKENNFLTGLAVFLEEDDMHMARFELYFKPFPLDHSNMLKALNLHQLEIPALDKDLITIYKRYFNHSGFIIDITSSLEHKKAQLV
jgi:amino acid adenylation domain-containing protein/thioester reductase-like protein